MSSVKKISSVVSNKLGNKVITPKRLQHPAIQTIHVDDVLAEQEAFPPYKQPILKGRPYMPSFDHPEMPTHLPAARKTFPLAFVASNEVNDIKKLAEACNKKLDKYMDEVGVLLFRNLPIKDATEFRSLMLEMGQDPLPEYQGGVARRNKTKGKGIFTANDEPLEYTIDNHCEMSYFKSGYPSRIAFFCQVALKEDGIGGETPITNMRHVADQMNQDLKDRLKKHWIKYYTFMENRAERGWGWQDRFFTEDKAEVEQLCKQDGITPIWNEDDSLTYHYNMPAFKKHPKLGFETWFNQAAVNHESNWKYCPNFFNVDKYPSTTAFGDGTPFTDYELGHMRSLMWKNAVGFKWRPGDVIIMDNFHIGHGRMGIMTPNGARMPERKIFASLIK